MKIDVNQINVGDFVQINMKEAATSEIRHYVKEGEWYEVVGKDYSVAPLRIKFTEDFSYWVLECRILTYKKKEEIMKENEQVEWKVGDEFEFKSGNEEFMKDWECSMNKRYTVKRVARSVVVAKNDRGEFLHINFDRIQKVDPVEELSREEKIKPDIEEKSELKEEKEQVEWKVGDKFTIKSSQLGLLEGPATTETIFEVTDVVQDGCRVRFDSTEYNGWRGDARWVHEIVKVEDGCVEDKKQKGKEEMKSVERTAFNFDCHEQIKEKLNYLNLSQVAKDDILGLVELYVETAVEQKRVEFEQEIDQRYQEKLESLKKVLDI